MIIKTTIKKYGNELPSDYIHLPFVDITNQSIEFEEHTLVKSGDKILGIVIDAKENEDYIELTISLNYEVGAGYENGKPFEIICKEYIN